MAKGNFTISWLDVHIDKNPADVCKNFRCSEYSIGLLGEDNTGRVHPISKKDAARLKKKLDSFKKDIRSDMLAAAKRFQKETGGGRLL